MFITDFSVKRPVSALMLILIIVVLGIMSFSRLPVDLMPDLEFPVATVITEYEGVGPEEIESSVTRLIESSVNRVDGVKNIYSVSQRSTSIVRAEFEWGKDMDLATQDIREKIDELGTGYLGLPEDSKRPIIIKYNPSDMPLLFISLSGKGRERYQLKKTAEDYLENQLEAVEGVAWVVIFAGEDREILVSLDRDLLSAYHISISQIIGKLSSENVDSSSGHFKEGYRDYLIRAKGKFEKIDEIGETVLAVRNGAPIHLRDVAKVYDTFGEKVVYTRTNREDSAAIMLMKQAGTNTVKVCKKVWQRIEEIKAHLPPGITIRTGFDQSEYINKAIGNLGANAFWGGSLAILILFFFLRHVRALIIIALAIPISLLAAFVPMYFSHMTLNMMSLGGLALAVGMLLDNSIVVLENSFRRLQDEKESRYEAARNGASEVAAPIVASTFTTIGVFVPVAFTTGIAARLFRQLALTVSYSLLASLFLAMTLVPVMASKILTAGAGESRIVNRLRDRYSKVLGFSLKNPGKVVSAGLVILFASLFLFFPIGKEFMPTANDRMFMMSVSLPQGTRLEETNKVAAEIEKVLTSLTELETEQVVVGVKSAGPGEESLAPEYMMGFVRLVEADERKRTTPEVIEDVRRKVSLLPQIEKLDFMNLQTRPYGGGEAKPVEVKIFGKHLPTLSELSREAMGKMRGIEGLTDIEETFSYGSPELKIEFDRELCAQHGLSVGEVSSILEAAIGGKVVTRFEKEGEEIDVRVRLRKEDRVSLEEIKRISFLTPDGAGVRLAEIAGVRESTGPSEVIRENQKRKATILANVSHWTSLSHVMAQVQKSLADMKMPPGYFVEYGGSYEKMLESFLNLGIAFILAIILVYMIMAAQFESFSQPFVIMLSIPFSLIGVLFVLFIAKMNLSVNSLVGVIMLSGIVVNNGIVLIDYINRLRRQGMEKLEAIMKGAQVRFRPILMTTSTTILGVAPMVFMGGSGAEMRRPLALSVMGGLIFGLIVTLVIMPAFYSLIDSLSLRLRKRLIG